MKIAVTGLTPEEKDLFNALKQAFENEEQLLEIDPSLLKPLNPITASLISSLGSIFTKTTPPQEASRPTNKDNIFEHSNLAILSKTFPVLPILKEQISKNIEYIQHSSLLTMEQKSSLTATESALNDAISIFNDFTDKERFLKTNIGLDIAQSLRGIFLRTYQFSNDLQKIKNSLIAPIKHQELLDTKKKALILETNLKELIADPIIERFISEGEACFRKEMAENNPDIDLSQEKEALKAIAVFLLPTLKHQALPMVSVFAKQSVLKILDYTSKLPQTKLITHHVLIEGFIKGAVSHSSLLYEVHPALYSLSSLFIDAFAHSEKVNEVLSDLIKSQKPSPEVIQSILKNWETTLFNKKEKIEKDLAEVNDIIGNLELQESTLKEEGTLPLEKVRIFFNEINEHTLSPSIIDAYLQLTKIAYGIYNKTIAPQNLSISPQILRRSAQAHASLKEEQDFKQPFFSLAKDEFTRQQQELFNQSLRNAKTSDFPTRVTILNDIFSQLIEKNEKEITRIEEAKKSLKQLFSDEENKAIFENYLFYKTNVYDFKTTVSKLKRLNKYQVLDESELLYDATSDLATHLYEAYIFFSKFTPEKLGHAKLSMEELAHFKKNDLYDDVRWYGCSSSFYRASRKAFQEGFLHQAGFSSDTDKLTIIASILGTVSYIYRHTFTYLDREDAYILGKHLATALEPNYNKFKDETNSAFALIQQSLESTSSDFGKEKLALSGKKIGQSRRIRDLLEAYLHPESAKRHFDFDHAQDPIGPIRIQLINWELQPENELKIWQLQTLNNNVKYLEILLAKDKEHTLPKMLTNIGSTIEAILDDPLLKEMQNFAYEEEIEDFIDILQQQAHTAKQNEISDLMISDTITTLAKILITLKTNAVASQRLRNNIASEVGEGSISDHDAKMIKEKFFQSQPLIEQIFDLQAKIQRLRDQIQYPSQLQKLSLDELRSTPIQLEKLQLDQLISATPTENINLTEKFQEILKRSFFEDNLNNKNFFEDPLFHLLLPEETRTLLVNEVFKHYSYIACYVVEKDFRHITQGLYKSLSSTLRKNEDLKNNIEEAIKSTGSLNDPFTPLEERISPLIQELVKQNMTEFNEEEVQNIYISIPTAFYHYLPTSTTVHKVISGHFKKTIVDKLAPAIINHLSNTIETCRQEIAPKITDLDHVVTNSKDALRTLEQEVRTLEIRQAEAIVVANEAVSHSAMAAPDTACNTTATKEQVGQAEVSTFSWMAFFKQLFTYIKETATSFTDKAFQVMKGLVKKRNKHSDPEPSSPAASASQSTDMSHEKPAVAPPLSEQPKPGFTIVAPIGVDNIHIADLTEQALQPKNLKVHEVYAKQYESQEEKLVTSL